MLRHAAAVAVVGLGVWAGTACAPPPVTAPPGDCDPNYSGACVPIDSDVDCAGGTGDGPSYVTGPVTVIGIDIYGLDSDGNDIGCEN
jgi:resuscitation-promoting factor RpfB